MLKIKKEIPIKILFIGDKNVGKTSILTQYCHNLFINKYQPTENYQFFSNQIDLKDKSYKLQIWDIAGQNSNENLISDTFLSMTSFIVLVYNIVDHNSFKKIEKIITSIKKNINYNDNMNLIIVGNKNDLNNREVHISEGEFLSNEVNASFIELNSKKISEINKLFTLIENQINSKEKLNKFVKKYDEDVCCNWCC